MANDIHSQLTAYSNALKEDIIKYQNNMARHMVQEMAEDLTNYSKQVIEDFYKQYTPKSRSIEQDGKERPHGFYYVRHWNFRDVPEKYYKKRGDVFLGGLVLDNDLPDVYSGEYSEPEFVFNRVIFNGLHGFASLGIPKKIVNKPPIFSPSPYDRIRKKYEEICDNYKTYEAKADKLAQKDKYTILFR